MHPLAPQPPPSAGTPPPGASSLRHPPRPVAPDPKSKELRTATESLRSPSQWRATQKLRGGSTIRLGVGDEASSRSRYCCSRQPGRPAAVAAYQWVGPAVAVRRYLGMVPPGRYLRECPSGTVSLDGTSGRDLRAGPRDGLYLARYSYHRCFLHPESAASGQYLNLNQVRQQTGIWRQRLRPFIGPVTAR